MGGKYTHPARSGTLTAEAYNADHQNHIDNLIPSKIDDHSEDLTQMRQVTDPYPSGVAAPGGTLAIEIEQIRYQIRSIIGDSYWYQDPGVVWRKGAWAWAQDGSGITITATQTIPADNTIPQITEGRDILSLASFSGVASGSILEIRGQLNIDATTTQTVTVAIFNGVSGVTDCADCWQINGKGKLTAETFHQIYAVGASGGNYAFKLRIGADSGQMYLNRTAAATGVYGGVADSNWIIKETRGANNL